MREESHKITDDLSSDSQIHFAVGLNGMLIQMLTTEGTRADCKQAIHLTNGISAEALLVDRLGI